MKGLIWFPLLILTACSSIFPEVLNTVDDIVTDECVEIKIYRDAFKKDADIDASVQVHNKS